MKLLTEKVVYHRYRTIIERTFIDKDGKEIIWEVRGGNNTGVSIVALTKNEEIILIKEFKPGPNRYFTDIPGGTTDTGENIIDCAKRELLEETGYQAESGEMISEYYLDSYSRNKNSVVLLRNCIRTSAKTEGDIKVSKIPVKKFFQNLKPENTINIHALLIAKNYLLK